MTDPTPGTARPPHSGPRSYRPGEWYAVLGPRTVLLLPPDQRARAARLWELADEGADLEDLLDAVLAGGLRSLSGFALAGVVEGGDTRVLLRGPVHAELRGPDGIVSLDGAEASSFLDRSVAGVQQLTLSAGDAEGPDLVLTDGLVRAARVDHPPHVAPVPVPPPAAPLVADADEVEDVAVAPPPPPSTPPPPPPPAPPAPPSAPPPGVVPFGGPDTGPIGAVDPEAEAPTAMDLPAVSDFPPVPPPPMGGPSPVPATPPPGAPVGWGAGRGEGAHRYEGEAGQPVEPEPPARATDAPVARLIVSDGTVVDVDRPVLIGRAPSPGRGESGEDARLVTVPSPHQEISATHLEVSPGIGADTGSAVVTDLGSTNGSVLARPGLPPEALQPGIAALLVPGSLIDLGDGVTIQVTTP